MRNEKNVKRFRQWREVKWGAAFEQNTFLHVQGPGLKPHLHRKLYMAIVELDKATDYRCQGFRHVRTFTIKLTAGIKKRDTKCAPFPGFAQK